MLNKYVLNKWVNYEWRVIKLTGLQNLILGLPGGPVVKTMSSQSGGTGMLPGHRIMILHGTAKKKKKGSSCLASKLESYKK